MTEQEALGVIKRLIGISPSEKILSAFKIVKSATEKQIAKKAYIETEKATQMHGDYDCYECPNCDCYIATKYDADHDECYRVDYCPNCGQAIDWS